MDDEEGLQLLTISRSQEREAKERASIVELEKKADSLGYGV